MNKATEATGALVDKMPPQVISTVITPPQMLSLAVQQGADLDKLEKLMDLQERWEKKEAEKAFSAAMAEFRRNCPSIEKTAKGQSNKFAPLHAAAEAIKEPLSSAGLSYRWKTEQEGGQLRVTCIVTHLQGHSESTALQSALDTSGNKNGVQAIGSTASYLERYTLFAALGLSSKDMDDDGAHYPQAKSSAQATLPPYSQERLNQYWDKWEEAVRTKKKTPADIIATLKTKHTLTEEQMAQLLELGAN